MNVLLLDGHPDEGHLASHLLDCYQRALPPGAEANRLAVRDLIFDPNLRHGYARRTDWEPDIRRFAEALDACDHLVVAFPMWWGSEPAQLKGLIDRAILPGFAFAYHANDPWWDRLLEGRSADVIVTMDTPPIFLRLAYGNAIVRRWKGQILGFVGFRPVRFLAYGPVRQGGANKRLPKWKKGIERLARTIKPGSPERKRGRLERFLDPATTT
ncbi:MAG: NAD(P)H-dependent oxidoreductase [Erythrobacter sp.]|jgi:NAD(P)H dehydrogenase (quinone)|nr:NAD(P)H-dependent oxidoreductase [Erythrobacter sp.]